MASGLTHAFAAIALTEIVSARKRDWRFRSLLVGSALLPDADVIGFALGIHYGDLFGHRGLSHSLLFAAAWSLTVVLWEYRRVKKGSNEWWTLLPINVSPIGFGQFLSHRGAAVMMSELLWIWLPLSV